MKKLTTKKIVEVGKPASAAAERMTRIYRLMNAGVSQRLATHIVDRDYEVRKIYS